MPREHRNIVKKNTFSLRCNQIRHTDTFSTFIHPTRFAHEPRTATATWQISPRFAVIQRNIRAKTVIASNFILFSHSFRVTFFLQRLSERAFDGLNNLRILNLEHNRLAVLEGGVFSGVPAVTTLNLNHNLLETLTYNNVLPIMDNLVNNTFSVLSISGKPIIK